jgi:predicted ATP-grasp superfamily ATP-dependent carboligase
MISKCYKHIIKNTYQPIALVLGSYITGLGVIRSLGRKGIPVICLDSDRKQVGFYSKYCNGIKSPNAVFKEEQYIDLLLEIGELMNYKGVLIPASDIEIFAILKNKSKLVKYYNFIMSDLPISELLINKSLLYKTLEKLDIKYPKTFYPDNLEKLMEISEEVEYPCIIKPALSCYFRLDFNKKLFIVKSKEELIADWKKANNQNHEVLVQEIIPGKVENMYGLNTYFRKGFKPRNIFMYQRIREWPHNFGNGCFIQKADIPELEKIVIDLVSKINFQGIIDAEFKKDLRDNSFKLIEINARPWMQNSLASRYGVNVAYLAYMDAIGKSLEEIDLYEGDIKWLMIYDDACSSLKSLNKKELTFHQLFSSYKCKKVHAFFARDDPLPFIVPFLKTLYNLSIFHPLKSYSKTKL